MEKREELKLFWKINCWLIITFFDLLYFYISNNLKCLLILSLITLILLIIKYKKHHKKYGNQRLGAVNIILVEGEYGIGKTTYVEKEYQNKNPLFINLYEESSKGNFLRDLYYKDSNIYFDGIFTLILLYFIFKYKEFGIVLAISSFLILYSKSFIYIMNFFIKKLIMENKFYLDGIIVNFSKYDNIIFDDLDRLSYDEQVEFLKIISYLKKHMFSDQQIICVGNFNNIDKIFIDKFINEKKIIDKKEHIESWLKIATNQGFVEDIDLYKDVLELFLPQINYRYMKKFEKYSEKNKQKNIVNNFIAFYINYYLEIDINCNDTIFKSEFNLISVEQIFGEIKHSYNEFYYSTLFKKLDKLISEKSIFNDFYTLTFRDREAYDITLEANSYIFKLNYKTKAEEKIFAENIYCYVEFKNIEIENFINQIEEKLKVPGSTQYIDNYTYDCKALIIRGLLEADKVLPEITYDLISKYKELLEKLKV